MDRPGGPSHPGGPEVMSLLRRVEQARQAAEARNAATGVPVMGDAPPAASPPLSSTGGSGATPAMPPTTNGGVAVADAPPAAPPAAPIASAPAAVRTPAPEELFREIRIRLQAEVVNAFDTLLDVKATDVRPKIEGIVDRTVKDGGFGINRDEHDRLVEELLNDVTGFGPLEPFLHDDSITEVMVNGPRHVYIERNGKIQRVDSV